MKTWAIRVHLILVTSFALALGNITVADVAMAAPKPKKTLRHFPLGNPANVQVSTARQSAVPAHLKKHNDEKHNDAERAAGASNDEKHNDEKHSDEKHSDEKHSDEKHNDAERAAGASNDEKHSDEKHSDAERAAGASIDDEKHNDAERAAGANNCCFGDAPGTAGSHPSTCTNLATDVNNCGACGNVCNLAHATSACTGGTCTVAACSPGAGNCDSNPANGCETSLTTDVNNCGACGNACNPGDTCTGGTCVSPCAPGTTFCSGVCVNEQTDPNNCGACGNVCVSGDTCVAGTCTPTTVASSCLPTSSLSVLIQGSTVTAYVPLGSWLESNTGVHVVPLEPTGSTTTVTTTGAVNSCSSNNVTGTTVCTGNSNDVYVINGTALSATPTANATASQGFSGGLCQTCGVAFDAGTGIAWIAAGSSGGGGQLEPLTPPNSFGTPVGLFGFQTSENVSMDPVRHLILSAVEIVGQFQIIDTITNAVYNSAVTFSDAAGTTDLDSTAEDCSTGIALAPIEFSQSVVLVNLAGVTYTSGSPGTWTGPTNVQDFSPDFDNLKAGTSGSAVAPGSHLAIIAGEFGGAGFGVLQLPSSITASDIPVAVDWVSANVPDTADGPWSMGLDPHTVTAYVSPNDGKAYALMINVQRSYLVKVDMALLLSAPRLAGTHTADPALIPAGTFTFVAQ